MWLSQLSEGLPQKAQSNKILAVYLLKVQQRVQQEPLYKVKAGKFASLMLYLFYCEDAVKGKKFVLDFLGFFELC